MQRLAVALMLLIFAAASHAANYKLNLFIWSEYIDPQIISDFEKRFDCRVTMDFYEDESGMMAKLQGGGAAQYDVIVPPDHIVPALIKLRLIAPLRQENIPNMRNIDERFARPWYDPSNNFTVPYQWGTVGIYVREGSDLPQTWGLLFDPKLQPGPFVLMDSMRDCIGAALKYKGHSLNSVDRSDLLEARDVLIGAKKRSLGFEGGVGGKNKVLAKQAAACIAYSGDAVRAMKEDKDNNTHYFIPKEGSEIWVDNLAICAKAPNRVVAEKFLNYILDPVVGARVADFNQYATPNKAALAHVHPSNLKNPIIYPDRETMQRLEMMKDVGKSTRLYDEVWTQVKSR